MSKRPRLLNTSHRKKKKKKIRISHTQGLRPEDDKARKEKKKNPGAADTERQARLGKGRLGSRSGADVDLRWTRGFGGCFGGGLFHIPRATAPLYLQMDRRLKVSPSNQGDFSEKAPFSPFPWIQRGFGANVNRRGREKRRKGHRGKGERIGRVIWVFNVASYGFNLVLITKSASIRRLRLAFSFSRNSRELGTVQYVSKGRCGISSKSFAKAVALHGLETSSSCLSACWVGSHGGALITRTVASRCSEAGNIDGRPERAFLPQSI